MNTSCVPVFTPLLTLVENLRFELSGLAYFAPLFSGPLFGRNRDANPSDSERSKNPVNRDLANH